MISRAVSFPFFSPDHPRLSLSRNVVLGPKSCPSQFWLQIPPAWIPPGKKTQPYTLWGKKGRGELLSLHLGQMKFLQFKREVVRDSIKDLEAVCSFALGSHPHGNNLGRKKPGLAPSSHPGSRTLAGIRVQGAVPLPAPPRTQPGGTEGWGWQVGKQKE